MDNTIFLTLIFTIALLGLVGIAGLINWAVDSFINWFTSGE